MHLSSLIRRPCDRFAYHHCCPCAPLLVFFRTSAGLVPLVSRCLPNTTTRHSSAVPHRHFLAQYESKKQLLCDFQTSFGDSQANLLYLFFDLKGEV